MRKLLVGVLSVTLIGCSCPPAPQAMLEACTSKPCFYRTAAIQPLELKPAPLRPNRTTTKVESKTATKTAKTSSVAAKAAKPNSPQTSNGSDQTSNGASKEKIGAPITVTTDSSAPQPEENANSTVGANVIVAGPRQASETSDPVLEKAKVTVSSKMEDPASAKFEDMTRAIRNDSFGQSIDTICGHVSGKKTSGGETGKRTFLYLVREDIAFVDYGYSNSVAATAYRTICTGN